MLNAKDLENRKILFLTDLQNNARIARTSSRDSFGTPFRASGQMTESFLLE